MSSAQGAPYQPLSAAATAAASAANLYQHMYHVLQTPLPPLCGEPLPPQRAADILAEVARSVYNSSFEFMVIDRPKDGTMFVFSSPNQVSLAADGYGWMDEEKRTEIVMGDGRKLEIYERGLGFGPTDTHATMCRRRYCLVGLSSPHHLQLIHYCRLSDHAPKFPVLREYVRVLPRGTQSVQQSMSSARSPPMNSAAGTPNVQPGFAGSPHMMSQSAAGSAAMMRGKHPQYEQASSYGASRSQQQQLTNQKKRGARQQQARQPVQFRMVEDENDPSGDELDGTVTRHVAIQRYKRNHEYIDEIFSPYHVDSIIPPPLIDTNPEKLETLRRKKDELKEEIEKLKRRQIGQTAALRAMAKTTWKAIDDVKKANNLQDLSNVQHSVETELGLTLKPHGPTVVRREIADAMT
ncbi:hypothetical protein HK102_012588 [Quaeritorhiza haematococci]|nr:hypothetical protein HK102_012588 [Quaeritorhiza haematococci]